MRLRASPCLILIALALAGCADQFEVGPPSVALETSSADGRKGYRGQGIMVGNRVVTAAHVIVHGGDPLPAAIRINGEMVRVTHGTHGDLATVRALYHPGHENTWDEIQEDWAALEVQDEMRIAPARWTPGTGETNPEEVLYAFQVGPEATTAVPLTVVDATLEGTGTRLPPAITIVRCPTKDSLHGFSGSFVGRFHRDAQQWELIGVLVSAVKPMGKNELHVVLRPPAQVIEWLVTGSQAQEPALIHDLPSK